MSTGAVVTIPRAVAVLLLAALRDEGRGLSPESRKMLAPCAEELGDAIQKANMDELAEAEHAEKVQAMRCAFRNHDTANKCVKDADTSDTHAHEDYAGRTFGKWSR